MTTVLVTGGTGALGSELVPMLVTAGCDVRVLTRREKPDLPSGVAVVRGDLATGAGLDAATDGADVIAHLATGSDKGLPTYKRAKRTDVEGTRALLDAARNAGSPHIVYISIVGIDRIAFGYYRAKLETEGVITSSGLPHTILRTTQWHTLAWEFCRLLSKLPAVVVPRGMRMQLLDAGEVAECMSELVQGAPAGYVAEMGGPEVLAFNDIVRKYLNATGKRRLVGSVTFPGKAVRGFREGHNLAPDQAVGTITWDEFLARRARAAT
jgi:uncharacterized protein YbjT (DUF2867 family)